MKTIKGPKHLQKKKHSQKPFIKGSKNSHQAWKVKQYLSHYFKISFMWDDCKY